LTYESSMLNKYYELYQPESAWDIFLGEDGGDGFSDACLKNYPTAAYFPPNPWDGHLIRARGEGGLPQSEGVQGYGPVSPRKGQLEFARLTGVFRSIQQHGYKPTGGPDGEIRGYFLRLDGDYRFFVRAGLHRMAALTALGHPTVRVRFKANYPRCVDLADIDHWPLVSGGFLERDQAAHIFRRHFMDDGPRRAKALGLLPAQETMAT
jgi:hypothetical protein